MKSWFKKNQAYVISGLLVTSILLIVYLIKGIYPFGTNSIVQGDFGQGYVPSYYYLWDVIHDGAGLFWNFNLSTGSNMYGAFVLNALFSPLTWLFLLIVPRVQIINSMSFLLLIKVILMALTATYAFSHLFKKVNPYYLIMFSVMYALSGYVLLTYHHIIWLDVLIVFPLFILSMVHLFKTGEAKWYVITLAISLILSYYISYMILMFILIAGAIGILLYVKKELRPKVAMKLVVGTLLALGISCIAFLPSFMQSHISMRMQNGAATSNASEFYTKLNYYLCLGAPLYFYILNLIKTFKEDKKQCLMWSLLILFTGIGLLVEPINMMWHSGSYNCFPYRYGFIPLMVLSLGSLNYLNNQKEGFSFKFNSKIALSDAIKVIASFILSLITIFVVILYKDWIINGNVAFGVYNQYLITGLILIASCFFLLLIINNLIKDQALKYLLMTMTILSQLLLNTYFYIGINQDTADLKEHTVLNAYTANETYTDFDLVTNGVDRYKDVSASFSENYPLIMKTPSLSGWLHIITSDQYHYFSYLGYSVHFTKLQDVGGTLFSDALMNVKYVFSSEELDSTIYTLVEEHNGLKLYELQTLAFGIVNQNADLTYDEDMTRFAYQNKIYQTLFNRDDNIIEVLAPEYQSYSSDQSIVFNSIYEIHNLNYKEVVFHFDTKQALYLDATATVPLIKVNGEIKLVPTINSSDNTSYTSFYQNGILDLGCYEGDVTVQLYYLGDDLDTSRFSFGTIDINKYLAFLDEYKQTNEVSINKSTMTITVDSAEDGYLFIPETYNDGFTITVNGETVKADIYLGTFMNIPIKEGTNTIVLSFTPSYFKISVIISLISLAFFIALVFINKKYHWDNHKIIQWIFTIIAIIIFIIYLYKVYIGPLL